MNVLYLNHISFNTRIALGGCMINIDGETKDCEITYDKEYRMYAVHVSCRKICEFAIHHIEPFCGMPTMFDIGSINREGKEVVLIIPTHGLLEKDMGDEDE